MLSFLAQSVPRTETAHQNPLISREGVAVTHFLTPEKTDEAFLMRQTYKIDKLKEFMKKYRKYSFAPPYHFHWDQSETFVIEKGSMVVKVDGKEQTFYAKDGPLKIEAGAYHTFDIGLSTNEDLVMKVNSQPEIGATDEKFFRNLFSYLDDCHKAGMKPSLFQMLLFIHDADASLAIGSVPSGVGRFVGKWVLGYIGGKVIGEKLLGYKSSYEEYYIDGESEKKRQ